MEITFLSELMDSQSINDGLNKKKYTEKYGKFRYKLLSKLNKIRFKH